MKRLFKVILPPLFAFWTFALLIKLDIIAHYIGRGSVYGLISYYRVFAPMQIGIALLTQWLIAMPLWDKIVAKPRTAFFIFTGIVFICLIFAFGIAYVIWDKTKGVKNLVDIGLFMTEVQLFYWGADFLVLYLLDWKAFKKTVPTIKKEKAPNH